MLKYGWVCESRTMTPGLSEFLKINHSAIFNAGGYKKIFVHEKELTKLNQNFVYCPAGSNLPWTPRGEYKIYEKTKCVLFFVPQNLALTDTTIELPLLKNLKMIHKLI